MYILYILYIQHHNENVTFQNNLAVFPLNDRKDFSSVPFNQTDSRSIVNKQLKGDLNVGFTVVLHISQIIISLLTMVGPHKMTLGSFVFINRFEHFK